MAPPQDAYMPDGNNDNNNNNYNNSSGSDNDDAGDYDGKDGDEIIQGMDTDNTKYYKICSELGVGTFGRVLECKERRPQGKQYVLTEEKFVAIKVVRRIKRYTKSAQIEADILKHLNKEEEKATLKTKAVYVYNQVNG